MSKVALHCIDQINNGGRGMDFSTRIAWLIRHFRKEWQLYLLLAPMIVWFLLFLYKPMYGLQIAFKDFSLFRGVDASPWVGLEHFRTLFDSDTFMRAIKNTFIISFLNLAIAFPMPIILALMFNEIVQGKFKKTIQTIVYLPHFISLVIIAGIVINAFSPSTGVVNLILGKFGIEPIYFLTQPEWFRPIFIGSGIWQEAGFQSIVYLAAIAGVSPSLYESAVVDGAYSLADDVEDYTALHFANYRHHADHTHRQSSGSGF